VQAGGESGEVGQGVAERGEFPVQEEVCAVGLDHEVDRLEIVVQPPGLDGEVGGIELAVQGHGFGGQVGCGCGVGGLDAGGGSGSRRGSRRHRRGGRYVGR